MAWEHRVSARAKRLHKREAEFSEVGTILRRAVLVLILEIAVGIALAVMIVRVRPGKPDLGMPMMIVLGTLAALVAFSIGIKLVGVTSDGESAYLGIVAGHVIFTGQFALIGWFARKFNFRNQSKKHRGIGSI